MSPTFSIVIPTCARDESLSRCLQCLAPSAQRWPAEDFEVVVTDDGNNSSTQALLSSQFPSVRHVQGPRRGPAANRNHGAAQACGEWLLFTDDDCLPDAGWLATYAEGIGRNPSDDVFEGRVYVDRPRRSLAEASPINDHGGNLWSCNFAIRHKLFFEMGGFTEAFPNPAMEDVEFATRLRKKGHRFLFLPAAAVCHPWRQVKNTKAIRDHELATRKYLELHPSELPRVSSKFFLKCFLRTLWHDLFLGAIRFRGAGLRIAISRAASQVRMALYVAQATRSSRQSEGS